MTRAPDADGPEAEAPSARSKTGPRSTNRKSKSEVPRASEQTDADGARALARQAKVRRRYKAEAAVSAPALAEATLLTEAQMREARQIIREKQSISRKEREFSRRLVATLTEGQNALNIAFGAILSAYIGTVLAAIDDKPFDQGTLALFFVLVGVFIGGLCIGNLVVLRRHFGLGLGFLVTGATAAALSLNAARALGFELPILKVMFICWYAMLVTTDGVLTAIVFFHHRSVVRRETQLARARAAEKAEKAA